MKALLSIIFATVVLATPVQAQGTGTCGCPGDVTGDNITDFSDLLNVLTDWGCMECPDTDIDGDGTVGFNDLLVLLSDWGCGFPASLTTISGTVVNAWTGDPIAGATVMLDECMFLTDENGEYVADLPIGSYDMTFSAAHFMDWELTNVILFPDHPTTVNAALDPVAAVVVEVVVTGSAMPDGTVEAFADVTVLDGSTIETFAWSQVSGAPAGLTGANTNTVNVALGSNADYKAHLIHVAEEPPVDPDLLPPNVPLPPGEFPGGLQNRWQVVGLNPLTLEEGALVVLEVDVTTTSGTYMGEGEVHTSLPYHPSAGIRTVGIGTRVLLHGKEQGAYDWSLQLPAGSSASLNDAMSRNPDFTPDVPGMYRASVTDEANGNVDVFIFAGNFRGIIVGEDADGLPVPEATCLNCHNEGGVAADQFNPWIETGHAIAFADKLNENSHFSSNCIECHAVGYNLDADNGGIDDAADYQAFLNSGLLNNPSPDNWTTMLANFPETARRTSIQCENCHGPQDGEPGLFGASHTAVFPRVSLSSDVCATCHGEPPRHGRFTQWQFSAHANYELAIDEGESGNCSRCHTANGFLAWLPVLLGDAPGDPLDDITVDWTMDETHPQTCVTCHDPHSVGTTSGEPNDATVRITGNTPPLIAGFTAYGVGRGAICMTCHNSRRGLHNDDVWPEYIGTSEVNRAPHGSAQADLLMGENAYLTTTGIRGNHSFVEDSCTNCHMVQTPPPGEISYNQSGTNHTFYASTDICSECHGPGFTAAGVQNGVQDTLDLLQGMIEDALVALMAEQIDLGNSIDLDGEVTITDIGDVDGVIFSETRGQQAMTVTIGGMDFGPYRMGNVHVLDASMVDLGQIYDFADEALPKAGWNWTLVHNDGSLGVHNPSFAYQALASGIQALDETLAMPWPEWLEARIAPEKSLSNR